MMIHALDDTSIILEGPDASGKSTLARQISVNSSFDVHHHGPYKDLDGGQIFKRYATSLAYYHSYGRVVLDRSWLSEPIYGEVMRKGENRIGISRRRILERLALSTRSVVVLTLPPLETVLEHWRRKKEGDYLDEERQLVCVYRKYAQLYYLYETDLPVAKYNWQTDGLALPSFMEYVQSLRPPRNLGPGVGSFAEGNTLLISDVPIDGGSTATYDRIFRWRGKTIPFGQPKNLSCSAWLNEKLEAWGVRESHLYWVNARSSREREIEPYFIDHLKPGKVVTLGREADRWATKYGINHTAVNHPLRQKLFDPVAPYELKEALQ